MQIACNRQVMKRKIWLHGAKRIAGLFPSNEKPNSPKQSTLNE